MSVALLSWESLPSIAVGGLGAHVSELAAALERRGHEVHLFTRAGPGQATYERINCVHYHRCPYDHHPDFLTDTTRMCDSLVWHLAETEAFLNRPFDIVHGHDWLAVRAMIQAKNRHQRPVVMTVHATEYGRCGNQLLEGMCRRIRDIEWEGTYIADRVIRVSGNLRTEVQDLYHVPMDKMHVVYNGVDVKRFDARVNVRSTRRKYSVREHDPLVLFAGRLTWQKGPDLLVDAMPDLLDDHPSAKFIFAGDGDMRDGLEHRAASMGVTAQARFVGYRQGRDLVDLFKTSDTVCVPSRNEPFGIVILEAWSARKPVVATRSGGPAEFVKHKDTGVTVSTGCDSIREGVSTILSDKKDGRRMGGKAAGERASELAIQTMTQYVLNVLPWFFRFHGEFEEDLHDELKGAMVRCEEVIGAESAAVPEYEGMGTTLTVGYVLWPKLYVVHVGDSRCYLLRGKKLRQITRDQTLAQSLVDQGAMKAKDIEDSPWIHLLWSAIGKGAENLSPEVYMADLEAGDSIMLCTDGLSQELSDKRIIKILRGGDDEKETCRHLVDAANDAGGSDHITVIVARCDGS